MFPKHKKHKQPVGGLTTPVVQNYKCSQPTEAVDTVKVDRIVAFGTRLHRSPVVDDTTLRNVATYIVRYSQAQCVEPELAAALFARESSYNPRAVSSSGARGIGQLIPSTAAKLGVTDSFDPEQNVRGSVSYLRELLDRWNGYPDQVERALASYNAGPRAVESRGPGVSAQFVSDILKYREKILAQ